MIIIFFPSILFQSSANSTPIQMLSTTSFSQLTKKHSSVQFFPCFFLGFGFHTSFHRNAGFVFTSPLPPLHRYFLNEIHLPGHDMPTSIISLLTYVVRKHHQLYDNHLYKRLVSTDISRISSFKIQKIQNIQVSSTNPTVSTYGKCVSKCICFEHLTPSCKECIEIEFAGKMSYNFGFLSDVVLLCNLKVATEIPFSILYFTPMENIFSKLFLYKNSF